MHIIETLDAGGAEKVLVDIVNHLPEEFESIVCCLKTSGIMAHRFVKNNLKIIELNKRNGNDFKLVFKLRHLLVKHEIDVVHAHNWNTFCESILACILSKGSKRIIHTIHGYHFDYPNSLYGQFKKRIRHFIEKLLSFRSYKICTVSNEIKRYIENEIQIKGSKIEVVLNGIDVDADAPYSISTSVINNKNNFFSLCFVGRLAVVKNLYTLLNAMKIIRKSISSIRLFIVGDGPERISLEAYAQEIGIDDCVIFLGYRDDVKSILRSMDVLILPSFYEGISVALLEAMSCGRPVIASQVGGNVETVIHNETGLLFPPRDINALAECVIELYSNPELCHRMGRNAKTRARKNFNIKTTIIQYVELYTDRLSLF